MRQQPILYVDHLQKNETLTGFPWNWVSINSDRSVVQDVSFSLQAGEIVGVEGASGCGKTALARMLAGIDRPTGGGIYLQWGESYLEVTSKSRKKWKSALTLIQPERIAGVTEGESQYLAMIRALSCKPRIVICDDSFSAIDVKLRSRFLHWVTTFQKELGTAFIFMGQNLDWIAPICGKIHEMKEGTVVKSGWMAGSCSKLQEEPRPIQPHLRDRFDYSYASFTSSSIGLKNVV